MSDSEGKGSGLSGEERESIALADKRATIVIGQKRSRWFREDSFRPYSGRKELDTAQCIADLNEFALAIFKTTAGISVAHANSIQELESSLRQHLDSIVARVCSFARYVPPEIRVDFEVGVPARVRDTLQAEQDATLLRFLDGESQTLRSHTQPERDRSGSSMPGDSPEVPEKLAMPPSNVAAVAHPQLDLAGEVPHFVFRYGQDFPIVDQDAIETIRLEANRKFGAKSVSSFEEWMSAREAWVSELVYGAAPVFGRVAVRLHWSADHRRDVLRGFIIQAARAGRLTLPRGQRFFAPPRAKQLDDALFPTGSPDTAKSNASITPGHPPEPALALRRKRGRPVEISDELKRRALLVKGGKERAKILYQTPYPTVQQVKNVPAILKHFNRKRQPKAE